MRCALSVFFWLTLVSPWNLAAEAPAAGKSGALAPAQTESSSSKVYQWLCAQQSQSGILGNQEGEFFAGLYPNALAAICFTHQGDIGRAEKILRFFQEHYDECFGEAPGGFYQFWDAGSGEGHRETDRWIGDNAWLLIAINYHREVTGSEEFDEMARGMEKWLLSLQDADGGIKSGFNTKGPMDSKSTEANLDCYAALVRHPAKREKIRRFLSDEMWIPKEKRFKMGTTCPDPALDTLSWGVAALGAKFKSGLGFAERTMTRAKTARGSGKMVIGFADFPGANRIWLEGTGEMAVAYHAVGNQAKARRTLAELEKAMIPSSKFERAAGLPCHTNDPAWATGSEVIFVPSQAWFLFGQWGFNPMATKPQGP